MNTTDLKLAERYDDILPKKVNPLQELTNKFLIEFFDLAYKLRVEENNDEKSTVKRQDSYEFNYTLADCLIGSDYVQTKEYDGDVPLIGMGFPSNIIEKMFALNIKGINEKLLFLIKNFNNQDSFLDYYLKDLNSNTKIIKVEGINLDWFEDKSLPMLQNEDVKETTFTFTLHNNKSGYEGFCKVTFHDGILEQTELFRTDSDYRYQYMLKIDKYEKPEIGHFKHIADINGFFNVIDQVKYGIKETLEKNKDKKS